jgi:hypothetical protein
VLSCGPGPGLGPCVVRRHCLLGRLSVLVWCLSLLPASICNPPREQLLAGLVAGTGSSVGCGGGCDAGIVRLVPGLLLFIVPRPPSCRLLLPVPIVHFLSVIALPSTPQAGARSGGKGWGAAVGCGVLYWGPSLQHV